MDIRNITKIAGNNNLSLQNITANDIVIYSGNEQNPEIKQTKADIAGKIASLAQLAGLRFEDSETLPIAGNIDEAEFTQIDFSDLIKSIRYGNCILFLGPEISVDETGASLHQKFCETRSNDKRKYNPKDCFFMPGAETRLINEAIDYYSRQFPMENKNGQLVLSKLAQIPFGLIISLAPDDTMHRILYNYNIEHHFIRYTGNKHERIDLSRKIPVIYNALGNASENGRYIYTHRQLDEYIKNDIEAKFPIEIENKIKMEETTHYLFIGLDFNKWYNKLLMYELNLLSEVESYAFNAGKVEELNQEFIKRQFNVTFIDANYTSFTDILLRKSKEDGLTRSLNESFVDTILAELETIRIAAIDSDKLADLKDLEIKLSDITKKINRS
jgi:hypothetical protein